MQLLVTRRSIRQLLLNLIYLLVNILKFNDNRIKTSVLRNKLVMELLSKNR